MTRRRPIQDDPSAPTRQSRGVAWSTRRLGIVLATGLVGVTLIVLFLSAPAPPRNEPTGSFARPSVTASRPALGGPLAPLEGPVTVVDGPFEQELDRSIRNATAHKNQSKLWFADGSWWGVLVEPVSLTGVEGD